MVGHGTEISAMFEMALVIGPSGGHCLHLIGGGGCSPYVMCQLTLFPFRSAGEVVDQGWARFTSGCLGDLHRVARHGRRMYEPGEGGCFAD